MPHAVGSLFARPWFQRIWTIQEAFLPTKALFIAGETSVDWVCLSLTRVRDLKLHIYMSSEGPPGLLQWLERRHSHTDLLFALTTTRNSLATDPRDKIYGLLGLLNEPRYESLVPNYDLTPEEVFINTTVFLISTHRSLAVLSCVETRDADGPLPSWVPDWSSQTSLQPTQPCFQHSTVWNDYPWLSNKLHPGLSSDASLDIFNGSFVPLEAGYARVLGGFLLGHILQSKACSELFNGEAVFARVHRV
jgi:hypothetical protein